MTFLVCLLGCFYKYGNTNNLSYSDDQSVTVLHEVASKWVSWLGQACQPQVVVFRAFDVKEGEASPGKNSSFRLLSMDCGCYAERHCTLSLATAGKGAGGYGMVLGTEQLEDQLDRPHTSLSCPQGGPKS